MSLFEMYVYYWNCVCLLELCMDVRALVWLELHVCVLMELCTCVCV